MKKQQQQKKNKKSVWPLHVAVTVKRQRRCNQNYTQFVCVLMDA